MNHTKNLIFLVVLTFLVLASACVPRELIPDLNNATSKPNEVNEIATMIADFDLPQGYKPDYALHALGFSLAGYSTGEPSQHILLMQLPPNMKLDATEMQQELMKATSNNNYTWMHIDMHVVDEKPVTLRDQPVTLITAEGKDGESDTFRQMTAVFEGKEGPAMVLIASDARYWNQEENEQFIASIR